MWLLILLVFFRVLLIKNLKFFFKGGFILFVYIFSSILYRFDAIQFNLHNKCDSVHFIFGANWYFFNFVHCEKVSWLRVLAFFWPFLLLIWLIFKDMKDFIYYFSVRYWAQLVLYLYHWLNPENGFWFTCRYLVLVLVLLKQVKKNWRFLHNMDNFKTKPKKV